MKTIRATGRHQLWGILVGTCLALLSVGASAEEPTGVDEAALFDPENRVESRGHIIDFDEEERTLVIRNADGEEERFQLSNTVMILGEDERLDLDALQLHQEVKVRAEIREGVQQDAEFVTIIDPRTVEHAVEEEATPLDALDTATVVSVDPEARTLSTRRDGGDGTRSFRVSEQTVIHSGSEEIALEEIEVGDRVVVMSQPGSDDEPPRASRIDVVRDPKDSAAQ